MLQLRHGVALRRKHLAVRFAAASAAAVGHRRCNNHDILRTLTAPTGNRRGVEGLQRWARTGCPLPIGQTSLRCARC